MDSSKLQAIEQHEYCKYTKQYNSGYGVSGHLKALCEFLGWMVNKEDTILDVGCGRGVLVERLRMAGYKAIGVDITLAGIKEDDASFVKAPIWSLPFDNDKFDYTVSSDVMEHLPTELVEDTIRELCRVTRKGMLHLISTRSSTIGVELHLTVKPIIWWQDIFDRIVTKDIICLVMEHGQFLKLYQAKVRTPATVERGNT